MLKINHKNHDIRIIGDSDTLKTEIGTLMLALCGEAAKQSKKAAADIFDSYLKTLAGIAAYLKREHHIDVKELLDEEPEEEEEEEEKESPTVSKDLDDAIESFFAFLDEIIEKKKKGDK